MPAKALKQASASYVEMAKRLAELEEKTKGLALAHGPFSRNTRAQLKQVFEALKELMTPPDPPKRPMGFVHHEEKKPGLAQAAATKSGRVRGKA